MGHARVAGLLLAMTAIGLWGYLAGSHAAARDDVALVAKAGIDAGVDAPADASVDAEPLSVFGGTPGPDGVMVEAAAGVWFIVPVGFMFSRNDDRSIDLDVPHVKITIAVSTGDRLRALEQPRDAILDFARHNDLRITSLVPDGTQRLVARMTGTDPKTPQDGTLMMHSQPSMRVTVIVTSEANRIGDPEVAKLVEESFHGRLIVP